MKLHITEEGVKEAIEANKFNTLEVKSRIAKLTTLANYLVEEKRSLERLLVTAKLAGEINVCDEPAAIRLSVKTNELTSRTVIRECKTIERQSSKSNPGN